MKKLLILGGLLMLTACGGEISESDLRDAIDEGSAYNRVCLPFELDVQDRLPAESVQQSSFGAPELKLLKRLANGKRANEHAIKQMESLVRAGLYKAEKEQRVGEDDEAVRYAVYSLTERGQEEIKTGRGAPLLCVGKQKVKKINYFTEPTAARGMMVTHVSYEAKLQPEKWANALLKEGQYKELSSETTSQTAVLMKTNKGWRDIRELQQ